MLISATKIPNIAHVALDCFARNDGLQFDRNWFYQK